MFYVLYLEMGSETPGRPLSKTQELIKTPTMQMTDLESQEWNWNN